jgi:hypothetical protein
MMPLRLGKTLRGCCKIWGSGFLQTSHRCAVIAQSRLAARVVVLTTCGVTQQFSSLRVAALILQTIALLIR